MQSAYVDTTLKLEEEESPHQACMHASEHKAQTTSTKNKHMRGTFNRKQLVKLVTQERTNQTRLAIT